MFGIGFTELVLIAIVAVLFLGPDKLPQAMVEIAKFIKSVKQTVSDAKSSLEEEIKIADLKEEALGYKKQLDKATDELKGFKNLSLDDFEDKFMNDQQESDVNAAQKHRQAVQEQASKENEGIATQVEPKQEHAELKKKPQAKPDPYAIADKTPKGSTVQTDTDKKEDA